MKHPEINLNKTFGDEEVAVLAEKVVEKRRTAKSRAVKKKTSRVDKGERAALERRRAARGKTIY